MAYSCWVLANSTDGGGGLDQELHITDSVTASEGLTATQHNSQAPLNVLHWVHKTYLCTDCQLSKPGSGWEMLDKRHIKERTSSTRAAATDDFLFVVRSMKCQKAVKAVTEWPRWERYSVYSHKRCKVTTTYWHLINCNAKIWTFFS